MKFPWPKEIQSPEKVWSSCRAEAALLVTSSREVQIFWSAWGEIPPQSLPELLARRGRAWTALLNAAEAPTLPMYEQEKLDTLLSLLTPEGINLQCDCAQCLARFQNRSELENHCCPQGSPGRCS